MNNKIENTKPELYYNINIKDENSIKKEIIMNIYMLYNNEKSSTLIRYSELTQSKFMNILNNNINLIRVIIKDNYKIHNFFINPLLLINYVNNNEYKNMIRYYFNKKIFIDLDSELGIKLLNKCNELCSIFTSLFIQPIIILDLKNK